MATLRKKRDGAACSSITSVVIAIGRDKLTIVYGSTGERDRAYTVETVQ